MKVVNIVLVRVMQPWGNWSRWEFVEFGDVSRSDIVEKLDKKFGVKQYQVKFIDTDKLAYLL